MPRFQTLPEFLQHWAEEKPHSPAFIFRDRSQNRRVLTWGSLYTLSGRLAADLRGWGMDKGDLVVNTLPNSPERVVCEAGIWMSGAASVNGQCLMTDGSDLLHTLHVSRAPTILLDPDVTSSPWNVLKNYVTLQDGVHVTSTQLPCLKRVIFVRRVENEGMGDFIGRLKAQQDWFMAHDVKPDDVFSVFTTSGTTGFSKLVIRTQGPFIDFLQSDNGFVRSVLGDEIQFNSSPMGWMGGCLIYSIVYGATRVTCDIRPGVPDDMAHFLWTCIQEEKCKTAILPSMLQSMAEIAKKENLKGDGQTLPWKLDVALIGGSPVYKHLVDAAFTVAHHVTVGYGATDFGFVSFLKLMDISEDFTDHDLGLPLADIEVRIVNMTDESKPCGPGETGHILMKGPNMMKGYLNNPKATAEAFTEDGFFRTGDVGCLDERCHLIVDGRGSDAIMRGAYIFYPTWIEKRLRGCPGICDVMVVGVPDPTLGEELCACVVPESQDLSLDQVREFTEGVFVSKNDPLSACPRHFVKFDSFPLTESGKPQRKTIKRQAAQQLGLVPKV